MIAITTKYHGPTNTRGSRISATANGHRVTIPYDYSLNTEALHAAAAVALCRKMQWRGELIAGGTASGYVFTFGDGNRYPIAATATV